MIFSLILLPAMKNGKGKTKTKDFPSEGRFRFLENASKFKRLSKILLSEIISMKLMLHNFPQIDSRQQRPRAKVRRNIF